MYVSNSHSDVTDLFSAEKIYTFTTYSKVLPSQLNIQEPNYNIH